MSPRYRADHVGSFLRPPAILSARRDPATTPEQLRHIEDTEILRVLQRQQDLGFSIFTDGELRRGSFMSGFYESVEGLDADGSVARAWKGQPGAPPMGRLTGLVVAPLKQKKRLTGHEVSFLRRHSPGDIKMTVPSANQFPAIAYKRGLSDRAYPTYSHFLQDVAPIIAAEIQALLRDGVTYIQIDAPRYSYYIDSKWREYVRREMGVDPDAAL